MSKIQKLIESGKISNQTNPGPVLEPGVINHMENTKEKLAFIITIPIWDNEGKQIMFNNNMENNNNIIKYNDFEIMNVIKTSLYFKASSSKIKGFVGIIAILHIIPFFRLL